MCESVCQLYRMAGCLEDEEDHGVSEHRITPLRCQPSKGYKPPFSQFPHQFLLSRSPDPFVKNSIHLSILHIYIRLSINNRIARANTFPSAEEASLLSVARRRLSRLVVVHKADTFLRGTRFLEHVCASRLYLSLPSAVSRAPFYPRTLAPREGRARGWISRRPVRNIPSPPASSSLSPYPPLSPRAMSQATFAPGARELGGLLGALLPPLLTPLTAHKVRTVRGRWFQGVARMGTDHKCTNIWTRA